MLSIRLQTDKEYQTCISYTVPPSLLINRKIVLLRILNHICLEAGIAIEDLPLNEGEIKAEFNKFQFCTRRKIKQFFDFVTQVCIIQTSKINFSWSNGSQHFTVEGWQVE